jgi:hypothetical protein
VGIFCASISSILAGLVAAPKILQQLGDDRLLPGLHILSKVSP